MKPAVFHEDAEAELDAAVAYYEDRRRGLGLDFQSRVEEAIGKIQRNPDRWPPYKNTEYRRYLVQKYPFSIYYLDLEDRIWIAAVAHQKRRPNYWVRRRPD